MLRLSLLIPSCILSSPSVRCAKNCVASRRSVMVKAGQTTRHGLVPPLIIEPKAEHKSSLIMIHGLGDTGEGWEDIGHMLAPDFPHTRWVFPNAPVIPITINGGARMPGWFDIASLDRIAADQDTEGMKASAAYIDTLIERETQGGLPSERVVVGGFSQGGALALLALRSERKLAAVLGLSCYLPMAQELPIASEANKSTPIFMAHGDCDGVVACEFGKHSYDMLREAGANVEFRTYQFMDHEARSDELADLREFLHKIIGAGGDAAGKL